MSILTEKIVAVMPIPASGSLTSDQFLITTDKAREIWCDQKKMPSNVNSVSFELVLAGSEYTKKDGTKAKLLKDRCNIKGFANVKEKTSEAAIAFFQSTGQVPVFGG